MRCRNLLLFPIPLECQAQEVSSRSLAGGSPYRVQVEWNPRRPDLDFSSAPNREELEAIVKESDKKKQKIRSGLSPKGVGLTTAGMVNLALMDKVLEVDKEKKLVKVHAGIRVQQLVDGIKEYGLTLQNFALIGEQKIGGIIQVGAHGIGARLPPIDEQVISMKLVTPAKGTIEV